MEDKISILLRFIHSQFPQARFEIIHNSFSPTLTHFIIREGANEKGFGTDDIKFYKPNELKIIRTYRFEGNSDPSDSSILYLLEANDGKVGYSIDAYGVYSNHDDALYDDFIRKIPMEERDEQIIFE